MSTEVRLGCIAVLQLITVLVVGFDLLALLDAVLAALVVEAVR
jgi:hypothetical protein